MELYLLNSGFGKACGHVSGNYFVIRGRYGNGQARERAVYWPAIPEGHTMAGSRRTVPLPPGWHAVATAILARDPVCRWGILPEEDGYCRSDSTEVDHIGQAWDHRPEVLRGICHIHHVARTSRQANAAKKLKRSQRYRPQENHPGWKGTALHTEGGTALGEEGTAPMREGTALLREGTALGDIGTALSHRGTAPHEGSR
jgi:hypothetical protein